MGVFPLLTGRERVFIIDVLLVRIHLIIVMIWWTGLAPWEHEFPVPGSLISTSIRIAGGVWRMREPRETLVSAPHRQPHLSNPKTQADPNSQTLAQRQTPTLKLLTTGKPQLSNPQS